MDAKCPKCNNVSSVPDNWQGKQGKCKKCGTAFQIPAKKQGPLPGETIVSVFYVVGGLLLFTSFICLFLAFVTLATETTSNGAVVPATTCLFIGISFGLTSVLPFGLAAIIQAINANTRQKH